LIKELILAFITGFIVGAVFKIFKLPIPAPGAFAGIIGILGIFLGATLIDHIIKLFVR